MLYSTKKFFITGTDTEIGKTHVSCGLLNIFRQNGFSTIALKPIAAGCTQTPAGLRNDDALILQRHATVKLPYHYVNPVALEQPIAPHIAAKNHNLSIDTKYLLTACQAALSTPADIYLIEGIGGWYVPINKNETMANFVEALHLSVILVVGMRLGCLNHALLTQHTILNQKIKFCGWVANCINPQMLALSKNINALTEQMAVPLLGIVPYGESIDGHIDINLLI